MCVCGRESETKGLKGLEIDGYIRQGGVCVRPCICACVQVCLHERVHVCMFL